MPREIYCVRNRRPVEFAMQAGVDTESGVVAAMSFVVLGTSIVLQLAAALLALRLVRVTGFLAAWLLVASALVLMALRRSITFYHLVVGDVPQVANIAAEVTALVISALMLVGIYLIRPHFMSHQEAHDTLRTSRERYRSILENLTDTFYRTDNTGRLTIVSSSVSDLLGYEPDELIGTRLSDLYVNIEERGVLLRELQATGRVVDFQAPLRRKDGSHVLVESNSRLVTNDAGDVIGVEGLARNITERKRTEQVNTRLGRLVEDSINEIYVFDSEDLHFTLVNRGARENLGYSLDEVRNLTPVDLKPEFCEQEFRSLIEPLRDDSSEILHFETVHSRKDGSTYPVEVRLQLSRSEMPPVYFAIIQDISERKQKEQELVQSQKLGAIGQLTGGIAHDFNNLLTVILGNLELALCHPRLPETIAECLSTSVDAAQKSASLTHRLLAFSRKQSLDPVFIELEQLIDSMFQLIRRSLRQDVTIDIECSPDTWPCEADASQLENVLLNLAINASDAMSDGGKLTIETSNVTLDDEFVSRHSAAAPGQYVRLSVTDTGHGMTPDVLARVFEPFFTTKQDCDGTGLGLSMVYGFIKQSGGIIEIESQSDNGTTVNVYLPRAPDRVDDAPAVQSDTEAPQGTGERVLIVEDNKNLLKLTGRLLDQLGYETVHALNANAAIEILEQRDDFDLLLTDVILRGSIDGVELAAKTQQRWPNLKVLYMSGYNESDLNRDRQPNSNVMLLHKPFSRSQLAQKVKQTCKSA